MKRLIRLLLAALAAVTLAFGLTPGVRAQDVVGKEEPKQALTMNYPSNGVLLQGKGEDELRYKGTIYVKVYAVSPRLKKKMGDGPVYTNELELDYGPRNVYTVNLPLGEYEVHFSMRDGDNLHTCIKRNVLLTAATEVTVRAELSGTTNTLIIGGTMTAQQMEESIKQLQQEVAALKEKSK